ncbi:hypothetical protein DV515_00001983, partial [Chloebia gouldiae]
MILGDRHSPLRCCTLTAKPYDALTTSLDSLCREQAQEISFWRGHSAQTGASETLQAESSAVSKLVGFSRGRDRAEMRDILLGILPALSGTHTAAAADKERFQPYPIQGRCPDGMYHIKEAMEVESFELFCLLLVQYILVQHENRALCQLPNNVAESVTWSQFHDMVHSTLTLLSAAAICTAAKSGQGQIAVWDGMNSYERSAKKLTHIGLFHVVYVSITCASNKDHSNRSGKLLGTRSMKILANVQISSIHNIMGHIQAEWREVVHINNTFAPKASKCIIAINKASIVAVAEEYCNGLGTSRVVALLLSLLANNGYKAMWGSQFERLKKKKHKKKKTNKKKNREREKEKCEETEEPMEIRPQEYQKIKQKVLEPKKKIKNKEMDVQFPFNIQTDATVYKQKERRRKEEKVLTDPQPDRLSYLGLRHLVACPDLEALGDLLIPTRETLGRWQVIDVRYSSRVQYDLVVQASLKLVRERSKLSYSKKLSGDITKAYK